MNLEKTLRMISASNVKRGLILGCFINAGGWYHTLQRIHRWSVSHESRYVCICNVHSLVTARQNPVLRNALLNADMATPDGMPIAWLLRRMGFVSQPRINGPDLMWKYCRMAERTHQSIFLYGSSQTTLDHLQRRLLISFPDLILAGTCSPPFRDLTVKEDQDITARINDSGASVVFISLGCPKQEIWMAAHHTKINAVMIGVGAAFDYHAGSIKRAPRWMQHYGLEWLHRLYSEPGRLWKRYLVTNSLFIVLAGWQLLMHKLNALFRN